MCSFFSVLFFVCIALCYNVNHRHVFTNVTKTDVCASTVLGKICNTDSNHNVDEKMITERSQQSWIYQLCLRRLQHKLLIKSSEMRQRNIPAQLLCWATEMMKYNHDLGKKVKTDGLMDGDGLTPQSSIVAT